MLAVWKDGAARSPNDIGETKDLAESQPAIVAKLQAMMDEIRPQLGDSLRGIQGGKRRSPAVSQNPKPLTTCDPKHPYIEPAYGLDEGG